MQQKNQNEPIIDEPLVSDLIDADGVGTIITKDGYRDVIVYGYFFLDKKWAFMIHQDVGNPEMVAVSEASTGYRLKRSRYLYVEDAYEDASNFIEQNRFYVPINILRSHVENKIDLKGRNTTNLQTLSMDTALWL